MAEVSVWGSKGRLSRKREIIDGLQCQTGVGVINVDVSYCDSLRPDCEKKNDSGPSKGITTIITTQSVLAARLIWRELSMPSAQVGGKISRIIKIVSTHPMPIHIMNLSLIIVGLTRMYYPNFHTCIQGCGYDILEEWRDSEGCGRRSDCGRLGRPRDSQCTGASKDV